MVSTNDFTVDPNGNNAGYDFFLDLDYPTGPPNARFVDGEYSTWKIANVVAEDFTSILVTGAGDDAHALVHIQGVSGDAFGRGSLKFTGVADDPMDPPDPPTDVPAPSVLALLAIGFTGLAFARRRMSR